MAEAVAADVSYVYLMISHRFLSQKYTIIAACRECGLRRRLNQQKVPRQAYGQSRLRDFGMRTDVRAGEGKIAVTFKRRFCDYCFGNERD